MTPDAPVTQQAITATKPLEFSLPHGPRIRDHSSTGTGRRSISMMIDLMAVPITFLLFRWTDIYMDFLFGYVYVKVNTQ